jgi:DNA-nicking Smr family endonuclease
VIYDRLVVAKGPKAPPPGFRNSPFQKLPPLPRPKPEAPPVPPAPTPKKPARQEEDDQRLFERAMAGVKPLDDRQRRQRGVDPAAPAAPPPRPAAARASEDALAEAELADLIENPGTLLTEEVGESVSALARGIDRRVLKRLRAGQFPVEEELDLHGRTREQAQAELVRFVAGARAAGRRCVLVIHGRGLGSGADGAVLRGTVREALAEGPLRRHLLAFASAPPALGGEGALLVLLRRKDRRPG